MRQSNITTKLCTCCHNFGQLGILVPRDIGPKKCARYNGLGWGLWSGHMFFMQVHLFIWWYSRVLQKAQKRIPIVYQVLQSWLVLNPWYFALADHKIEVLPKHHSTIIRLSKSIICTNDCYGNSLQKHMENQFGIVGWEI